MAEPACYLTIIKKMPYRGVTNEEWSNSYTLTGTTPADSTAWRALFDAIVAEERKLYTSSTSVVGGYGYDRVPRKGDHAIWSVDFNVIGGAVAGTLNNPGSPSFSGDQAAWIRWGLDRFNSNGKRVYLRKYYHDGVRGTANSDVLLAAYTTALLAFGNKMLDGTLLGARKICSPPNSDIGSEGGEVPIGTATSTFVTTRTLKRRGKRPPT